MGWVAQHGFGGDSGSSTESSDEGGTDTRSSSGSARGDPVLARSYYLRAIEAAGDAYRWAYKPAHRHTHTHTHTLYSRFVLLKVA
jgi:hypothetical protein